MARDAIEAIIDDLYFYGEIRTELVWGEPKPAFPPFVPSSKR